MFEGIGQRGKGTALGSNLKEDPNVPSEDKLKFPSKGYRSSKEIVLKVPVISWNEVGRVDCKNARGIFLSDGYVLRIGWLLKCTPGLGHTKLLNGHIFLFVSYTSIKLNLKKILPLLLFISKYLFSGQVRRLDYFKQIKMLLSVRKCLWHWFSIGAADDN